MIADHTAINAGFDFRRYAMKPTPTKPRIIIAQVEGSGTALTDCSKSPLKLALSKEAVESEFVKLAETIVSPGVFVKN